MAKRVQGTLYAYWSRRERDMMYDPPRPPDGHFIYNWFSYTKSELTGKTFLDELAERGYDVSTLKFSCKLKESK